VGEWPNAFGDFDRGIRGVGMASVVGPQTGAELLGATVYELSPGSRWADLHLHYANEEVLIVLAGTPTLHTHDGDRELAAGEVVTFPRGREGAHRLENASDTPTRVFAGVDHEYARHRRIPGQRQGLCYVGAAVHDRRA
jgi:uncharacterized cupin superfamily protein